MGLNVSEFLNTKFSTKDTVTVSAIELHQLLVEKRAAEEHAALLEGTNSKLKKELKFREEENLQLAKELAEANRAMNKAISKIVLINALKDSANERRVIDKLSQPIKVDLYA